MTIGRIEATIKITALPDDARTVDGKVTFAINVGPCVVRIALKPKTFAKLTEAAATWPTGWGASLTGKIGEVAPGQLVLTEVGVTCYCKKPKDALAVASPAAVPVPAATHSPPPAAPPPSPAPSTLANAYRRAHASQPIVEYRRPFRGP